MKKIAILLLIASSSFLVASELSACKAGVNARQRAIGGGVTLLVTGDEETINGGKACSRFKGIRDRAACIFGYNTIIPMMFGSNVVQGNGCDQGNMFNSPCPPWWNRSCSGSDGSCCVCGYEGTNNSAGQPDVYGVCQYGQGIGWNLSRVVPSTLGNYYYNGTTCDMAGNPVNAIGLLWGVNKNVNSKLVYTNWLNYIRVYVEKIRSDGSNSLFNCVPVTTISGADAVTKAS